jgi:hypothetical protein
MPEYKCFEDDAIKIIEKAIREGRTFRSRRELVELLVEYCKSRHKSGTYTESSAYRLIKKLEAKGLLRHVSGYGYVLADREHDNIIMSTCALLLDLVRPVKPVNEILREGFSRYYGEEMPGVIVLHLMERALEHVITSDERLIEEVKEAVMSEDLEDLREKEEVLLKKYGDLIGEKGVAYNINLIKEIERVLELKSPADTIYYANILLDKDHGLITDIVKNSDVKNACYKEILRYPEDLRQNIVRFCDKINILEKDAPIISSIIRIMRERYEINLKARKLEEKIERLYDKVINSMETFYLNTRMLGILTGWCEICRKGSIDDELKKFVKNFIKSKIEELLRGVWTTRITSY